MAEALATAFVRIRPDTRTFGKETEAGVSKAGKATTAAGKKQGKAFGLSFGSAAALAVGAGLIKFGKDSVNAFVEAEAAQTQLSDAFARFPKLADVNIGALQAYNEELAKKTKFDDDAVASGQAVLAQFVSSGSQLKNLTPLLADYAAKTGRDLPTAAKTLGKAFLGNTRALKELGVNYKPTGDKAKDMAAITELLAEKVGGFAEKQGKTAAGTAAILGNQFGELQEQVGAKLVPALAKLADIGIKVIGFIQENAAVIGPLAAALGAVVTVTYAWSVAQRVLNLALFANPIGIIVAAVAALVVGLIVAWKNSETFRKIVTGAFTKVRDVAVGVFNWVKKNWPLLLGIITGPIGAAVILIIKNWDTIRDGIKAVFDWIKNNWKKIFDFLTAPIGLVVNAVKASWKTLTDLTTGLWRGLKNVFLSGVQFITDKFLAAGELIIKGAAKAFGWIPGLGGKLKDAAKEFEKFRDNVNAQFDKIQDEAVNVDVHAPGWVTSREGRQFFFRARGGPVWGPGGPRSDSIPAMLSNGEYVVNAAATKTARPLLEAINARGLQTGGLVTNPRTRSALLDLYGFRRGFGAGLNRLSGNIQRRMLAPVQEWLRGLVAPVGGVSNAANVALGQRLAASIHGWTGGQWTALRNLWQNESGWNNLADNPTSTAFGIPQFIAATARAYGVLGVTNPVRQIIAGMRYIRAAYGSPSNAWAAWLSRSPHWYQRGTPFVPQTGPAILHRGEAVIPAGANRPGGNIYNVTVNVPPNANMHEIGRSTVEAIKAYERGSGAGWRR